MTKIQHVALWVKDLEAIRKFYMHYFSAVSGEKYTNPLKKFSSYMLTFKDGGVLEIMHRPDILTIKDVTDEHIGWAHIAIGVGTREKVLVITETIREEGYQVIGEPRITGDGYFESVILDPEGNRVEITV
jgi:lactoylglutathione lyase